MDVRGTYVYKVYMYVSTKHPESLPAVRPGSGRARRNARVMLTCLTCPPWTLPPDVGHCRLRDYRQPECSNLRCPIYALSHNKCRCYGQSCRCRRQMSPASSSSWPAGWIRPPYSHTDPMPSLTTPAAKCGAGEDLTSVFTSVQICFKTKV